MLNTCQLSVIGLLLPQLQVAAWIYDCTKFAVRQNAGNQQAEASPARISNNKKIRWRAHTDPPKPQTHIKFSFPASLGININNVTETKGIEANKDWNMNPTWPIKPSSHPPKPTSRLWDSPTHAHTRQDPHAPFVWTAAWLHSFHILRPRHTSD